MSKKQTQIRKKQPKGKRQNQGDWLGLSSEMVSKRKTDMSLWRRLWGRLRKRPAPDVEGQIGRDLIDRMDRQRIPAQEAQDMAASCQARLQTLQKQLPWVLGYLLGGGSLALCALIFGGVRFGEVPSWQTWFWGVACLLGLALLAYGWRRRGRLQKHLLPNSLLAEAAAAYSMAQMPGKGGGKYLAYQHLDWMRKRNRERMFPGKPKASGKQNSKSKPNQGK
jgi:hypothetical protein